MKAFLSLLVAGLVGCVTGGESDSSGEREVYASVNPIFSIELAGENVVLKSFYRESGLNLLPIKTSIRLDAHVSERRKSGDTTIVVATVGTVSDLLPDGSYVPRQGMESLIGSNFAKTENSVYSYSITAAIHGSTCFVSGSIASRASAGSP